MQSIEDTYSFRNILLHFREETKAKEKAILEAMMKDKGSKEIDGDKDDCKIFKAKPVPEHVGKPLFRQMVQEHPSRFKTGQMDLNDLKRPRSVPTNLGKEEGFKAKAFPREIFTDFALEQMKENERYRDVRKSLRQKALLSASKFPPRMEKELKNYKPKVKAKYNELELKQCKNDLVESKTFPVLKLPRFFITYTIREKRGNFKTRDFFD